MSKDVGSNQYQKFLLNSVTFIIALGGILFFLANALAGCEVPENTEIISTTDDLADTNSLRNPYYSLMGPEYEVRTNSLMLAMDEKPQLAVCVKTIGQAEFDLGDQEMLEQLAVKGLLAWNELLNEPAPISEDPTMIFPPWKKSFLQIVASCVEPDLTIEVNNTAHNSYGDISKHKILFWQEHMSDAEFTITHELGHIMGLGDTYTKFGYQVPLGQPRGIMGGRVGNEIKFSSDDRAAVWNVWRYVKNDDDRCGPGYDEGTARENFYHSKFCVPQKILPEDIQVCTLPCTNWKVAENDCMKSGDWFWYCMDGCLYPSMNCPKL